MSRILPALLIIFSLTTANADDAGTSFLAKPDEATIAKTTDWMSRLPDQVSLSQLSLPGTHDSCALYNGLSFGFGKCQSWRLRDQLKAGVRFIDIRCRHVGDRFQIYHGVIDQKMTFQEVRDICRKFLKDHPSECVVMSVKEESTASDNTRSFGETFAALTKDDGELWYTSSGVPKLGSIRKHIVVVDRAGVGGIPWEGLARQDNYTAPIELKRKLIREQFEKAMDIADDRWFINFCSGTVPGSFLTPKSYATETNMFALDFVRRQSSKRPRRLGTVVMDFPGEELIQQIIGTNFAKRMSSPIGN